MSSKIRQGLLLLASIALLAGGSTILYRQLLAPLALKAEDSQISDRLGVRHAPKSAAEAQGHFPAQSAEHYEFSRDGQDLFGLLVARYRDDSGQMQSAILFPKDAQAIASTPTGSRHEIWRSAAEAISRKAPEDALFLSWWDDGQRIHYLSGRETWLLRPSLKTFANPVWQALQDSLPIASDEESKRLEQMARWLTMDSARALAEIAAHFGPSRPVYLLVDNDLLLHRDEFKAYGGTYLPIETKNIPAGGDLHGDIAQVQRWANEAGDGNYLAQKEGNYYRVWSAPDPNVKNSLLVRLLPFIDSLKKLPDGVSLVYQSHWGGFLSIYQINSRPQL
jgi:hydroxylamine oxidation protein HaoB